MFFIKKFFFFFSFFLRVQTQLESGIFGGFFNPPNTVNLRDDFADGPDNQSHHDGHTNPQYPEDWCHHVVDDEANTIEYFLKESHCEELEKFSDNEISAVIMK